MFYAPLGNIRICEYNSLPPPGDDVTFRKMSGGLGKISSLDLGDNIRICEYAPSPLDDVTFGKMSGGLGNISSPGPRG